MTIELAISQTRYCVTLERISLDYNYHESHDYSICLQRFQMFQLFLTVSKIQYIFCLNSLVKKDIFPKHIDTF